MSIIDRQRVAVATAGPFGYTFSPADGWSTPPNAARTPAATACAEADATHALVPFRADKRAGCSEVSEVAIEHAHIADTAESCESRRWALGKEQGGKG